MKKVALVIVFLVFVSFKSFAQFGVSIHQTNMPFVGFNYELKNDKYMGELRLSTDNYFINFSPELVFTRFIKRDDSYDFYAGLGVRVNLFEGVVFPIGLNIYPLEKKNFGFHMEVTPIFGVDNLSRGTWGIRYRFGDRQK